MIYFADIIPIPRFFPHFTMIENRLILLLRKSKSLTPKFSASSSSKWKSFSTPSTEPHSKSYYSFSRLIPSAKTPITRTFTGSGFRSLLQNSYKVFECFFFVFFFGLVIQYKCNETGSKLNLR